MNHKFPVMALLCFSLTACVIFPTNREYYKPVVSNGFVPTKSQSCGYHKAAYDGLAYSFNDYSIDVYPDYIDATNLTVTFVSQSKFDEDYLSKSQFEFWLNGNDYFAAQPTLEHHYIDYKNTSYYWYKAVVKHDQLINEVENRLKLAIKPEESEIVYFNFVYTSQKDIYYGSINC